MALVCTPENLLEEVTAAIKFRKKHTDMCEPLHRQYVGDSYQAGRGAEYPVHHNHAFEFIRQWVARLAYSNPKVRVKSRRPAAARMIVLALKAGLNRWVNDVDFAARIREIVHDLALDGWGVLQLRLEPLPGYETSDTPPLRPTFERTSPKQFFMDPQATSPRAARFMGHTWLKDRADLLAATDAAGMPLYDAQALTEVSTAELAEGSPAMKTLRELGIERVERDQIVGMEIYVRETDTIYTMAFNQVTSEIGFLRAPRKAFAPPGGPYILCGVYLVPDQLYPLSPLIVTKNLVDEINAQEEQISSQADQAKTVTFVNAANAQLKAAATSAPHGAVIPIAAFDPSQIHTMVVAPASRDQMDYVDRLKGILTRAAGLTEQSSGISTGVTAREVEALDGREDERSAYADLCVKRSCEDVLRSAAWYMCASTSVVFPVSAPSQSARPMPLPDGSMIMMPAVPEKDQVFVGGIQPGQDANVFYDLELEIQAGSMTKQDRGVRLAQIDQAMTRTIEVSQMMMGNPLVRWRAMMTEYYDAEGGWAAEEFLDFDLFEALQTMQGIMPMGNGTPPDGGVTRGPAGMAGNDAMRQGLPQLGPQQPMPGVQGMGQQQQRPGAGGGGGWKPAGPPAGAGAQPRRPGGNVAGQPVRPQQRSKAMAG
jgi:hypothetical protein